MTTDGTQDAGGKPKQLEKRPVPGLVQGALMAEMVVSITGRLSLATNNSPAVTDQLRNGKEIFVPPDALKSFVETGSLQLPSRAERGITATELIAEILAFIVTWADMCEE